MSTIQEAIQSVQDYGDNFTKALERHRGFLGDGDGTVYVADRDGYVYVRNRQAESADITGDMEPEEVIYARSDIPPIEGYPVIYGRDIDTEDFQLLATDSKQLLGWIFDKYIKDHHEQHEFNEYDTVWIQKQAMLPLLVYPTSPVSMTLNVHHGWYQWDTDWHFFETTTSSELSSYVPVQSGKARFLLICIDGETETLYYESGDTFIIFLPPKDCEDRIPPPPEGKIPLAAIYLPYGTISIDWDIIYDVRLLFSGGGSMSTGSAPRDAAYVTLAYNDTLSAERLLSAGHGIIVTDNGPNDTVVVSVNSAADYNWSGDHTFENGITFENGVTFAGGAGANSIVIPDGLADAFDITNGAEFLRLNTDDDYFLIDPGAAGIKVGIGTTTVPHGGIGWGRFAIDGTTNSMAGPHVLVTVSADDYPVFQQLNWAHDVIEMMFDAYYDGAYKSSDAGSNCNIRKRADQLDFLYDSGVAQGGAVTWNNGIVMGLTDGAITVGGPSLTVPDDWWIGIGAALERVVFDTAGDICVMGANFGVGTLAPADTIHAYSLAGISGVQAESGAAALWAQFTQKNDLGHAIYTRAYGSTAAGADAGQARADWAAILVSNFNGLIIDTLQAVPIIFGTNDTERARISGAGVVKITSLAGAGVRAVVAAADGTLSAP